MAEGEYSGFAGCAVKKEGTAAVSGPDISGQCPKKKPDRQQTTEKSRTAVLSGCAGFQSVEKVHSQKNNTQKVFARLFQKAVGSRGKAPVVLRRGRNFSLQRAQEGAGSCASCGSLPQSGKRPQAERSSPSDELPEDGSAVLIPSQHNAMRCAWGSPMRRIRILLLCILLFAKKFFDTLRGRGNFLPRPL